MIANAAVPQRSDNPPTLTLAVIELVGGDALERMAATLQKLVSQYSVTALIICRSGRHIGLDPVLFPNVMIVESGGDTVPMRRLCALENSHSDLICLIEDTMSISSDWVQEVLIAFEDERTGAAWGPIKISSELGPRYWALALLEYGRFSRPHIQKGFANHIPGCIMAFRRKSLSAAIDPIANGIFEHAIAVNLTNDGQFINYQAGLHSTYNVEDEYSAKLTTRINHGRLYAGMITKNEPLTRRLIGAMRSVLAPGLFIIRGIRDSLSMSHDRLSFMRLFWLVSLSVAWGVGELTGFLMGAGDSIRSWR